MLPAYLTRFQTASPRYNASAFFGALMENLHGIDGLRKLPQGAIISIGNFDGIHLGHRRILQMAQKHASDVQTSVAVVTFEPHPLTVLRPNSLRRD